jgi:hypothetical protein
MKMPRQVINQNEIHCLNRTVSTSRHALQQTCSGALIIIYDFSPVLNDNEVNSVCVSFVLPFLLPALDR